MLTTIMNFLSLGCLAFLLPLDIWRFLFHSTITEKFIDKRLSHEVKYALEVSENILVASATGKIFSKVMGFLSKCGVMLIYFVCKENIVSG